jgi:protease II
VLLAPSSRPRRLRDDSRSDKNVLGYLTAENDYADACFEQLQLLVDSLADSMDAAVPAVEVGQVGLQETYLSSSSRAYPHEG